MKKRDKEYEIVIFGILVIFLIVLFFLIKPSFIGFVVFEGSENITFSDGNDYVYNDSLILVDNV